MDPDTITAARERLQARARALRDELATVDAEQAAPPTTQQGDDVADSAETGEQRSREAVRDAEQARDAGELREIAAALGRIEQGVYGACTDCGNDIAAARLQVQPAAARCIECQTAWERTHPVELRAAPPGPAPRSGA